MKEQITQDGYDELVNELENRKTNLRESIANDIELAREQGDLSENAAYKAAMEAKEFNETRIVEIEQMLQNLEVYESNFKNNTVELGESIRLINKSTGAEMVMRLVHGNEANPAEKKISIDSPIGKAVLGKRYGQEVSIDLPSGKQLFEVHKS
jgi:transcription elongation factor GreA